MMTAPRCRNEGREECVATDVLVSDRLWANINRKEPEKTADSFRGAVTVPNHYWQTATVGVGVSDTRSFLL